MANNTTPTITLLEKEVITNEKSKMLILRFYVSDEMNGAPAFPSINVNYGLGKD
jgi:hypothetical protein